MSEFSFDNQADPVTHLIKKTQIIKTLPFYKPSLLSIISMTGGSKEGISPTEVHDILRNERRTRAIECLLEEGPTTVRDLSERIAEMETGESPPPCEARKSVYVTLHQNHLSKMEEAGVIKRDSNEVEIGDCIEEVSKHVTNTDEGSRWAEVCAALSLLGILTVGAATFGVPGQQISRLGFLDDAAGTVEIILFVVILVVCLRVSFYSENVVSRKA